MNPLKNLIILLSAILTVILSQTAYSKTVNVACVGDSITYGSGIQNRSENSYPAQLQRLLGDTYDVKNFGVGGSTMLKNGNKPYWTQGQFQAALDMQPEIVIIKLGTNDSKPIHWESHGDEFKSDYIEMIETFRSLDSKPEIWICLPVPVFATIWGINDATVLGEIIPLILEVTNETGASLIDLNTPFVGKPELFPDKVHPSAAGAKLIAETVFTALSNQ